jgi:hypothetical protein
MAGKDPTILLTYRRTISRMGEWNDHWTVEKVTDSLLYNPGQSLTKKEVQDLCEIGKWKVTVVGPK